MYLFTQTVYTRLFTHCTRNLASEMRCLRRHDDINFYTVFDKTKQSDKAISKNLLASLADKCLRYAHISNRTAKSSFNNNKVR